MSLSKLMSLIRAGLLQVWLVENKIHWQPTRQKNKAYLPALREFAGPMLVMLASSDTRICADVQSHWPEYVQKAPWYSCPACALKRTAMARELVS